MDTIQKSKQLMRKEALYKRNQFLKDKKQQADLLILDKVLGHNWFYQAKNILVYVSYQSEVDTKELIKECFKKNKNVFVPKIKGNEMIFYQIYNFNQLLPNNQGILEPIVEDKPFIYDGNNLKNTLMLLPGVAFDLALNRMGYGKGFYDRFLQKYEISMKMALAYDLQIVSKIPVDEYDQKVDVIITEGINNGGFYQ